MARIAAATHKYVTSPAEDLRIYELARGNEFFYIIHSFADRKDRRSFFLHDRGRKAVSSGMSIDYSKMPEVFVMMKDFVYSVVWTARTRRRWDVFVAIDSLNFLSAYVLRKMGVCKRVVFWTTDFTPARFANPVLNTIYHRTNVFALNHADVCWFLSRRMIDGATRSYQVSHPEKEVLVSRGAWVINSPLDFEDIEKHTAVFLGHILEKQGLQVAVRAIPKIVQSVPDFKLLVIGSGPYEANVRGLVKELGVEKHVQFAGIILSDKEVQARLARCAVGLAPYDRSKDTWTYFADPGKIREYMAAGLPVIMTDLPYNAKELEERRCAMIVRYSEEDLADSITDLMMDEGLLRDYRNNALAYSRTFDWGTIFGSATRSSWQT